MCRLASRSTSTSLLTMDNSRSSTDCKALSWLMRFPHSGDCTFQNLLKVLYNVYAVNVNTLRVRGVEIGGYVFLAWSVTSGRGIPSPPRKNFLFKGHD